MSGGIRVHAVCGQSEWRGRRDPGIVDLMEVSGNVEYRGDPDGLLARV